MRRTIGILTATVMALIIGGCGGDGGTGSTSGSDAGQRRSVVHAMGRTQITGTPERVVVLDTGELDSAVALGIKPVGAVEAIAGAGFPAYLADAVTGV